MYCEGTTRLSENLRPTTLSWNQQCESFNKCVYSADWRWSMIAYDGNDGRKQEMRLCPAGSSEVPGAQSLSPRGRSTEGREKSNEAVDDVTLEIQSSSVLH